MNVDDMMNHMNFSKTEEIIFKEVCEQLNEDYEDAKTILLDDETEDISDLEEDFGPDTIQYLCILDRIMVEQENIKNNLCQHPSIIINQQAFRLANIAAGFLVSLHNVLFKEIQDDETS